LTLTIISARSKISFAVATMVAPAATYCSSDRPISAAGAFCTSTWWPRDDQLVHAGRGQADPVFMVFDFFWNAN
jgi:hypothetical protein